MPWKPVTIYEQVEDRNAPPRKVWIGDMGGGDAAQGPPGPPGARIYTGTGDPVTPRAVGDHYVNTANGDLWEYT